MEPSNILLLGGCGFIGRNLVSYLIDNGLVRYLRVVDKVSPQLAWLGEPHAKHFQSPQVEFQSWNLINPESCRNAFILPDGMCWDYVINCAGETKLSQTGAIYEEGILELSVNCAKEAARYGIKHYVELSAGQLYSSENVPHKEDDDVAPWTSIARWKYEVEKELKAIPSLKYTILRPAFVYGPGDKDGLMTRVIIAHLYKHKTMRMLWNAHLQMNTVHVVDVCRAICFVCGKESTVGETFNVVDAARSTQGTLSDLISHLLDIRVEYCSALVSSIVDLPLAANVNNEKHLVAWAKACAASGVENTPLSPYVTAEVLLHKHLHLDGRKLRSAGFDYVVPCPTAQHIHAMIAYYKDMNAFPADLAVCKPSNGVLAASLCDINS